MKFGVLDNRNHDFWWPGGHEATSDSTVVRTGTAYEDDGS
jgi:hypothetical protein